MKIITRITDPMTGWYTGFITEYPDNEYIDRTIVYGYETTDSGEILEKGKIIVIMRSGEQYEFECMASTVYCGQFGITVSKDGMYIYIISDKVGLWCYTYNGEIKWKTRYTSVGQVIANDDLTVTCVASTKLLLLDENGKKIKERKIVPYHAEMASQNVIYAAITETTVALIDSETLEVLWQRSLKELELEKTRYALIKDSCVIVKGEKPNGRIVYLEIELPEDVLKKSQYDMTLASQNGFSLYLKIKFA